MLSNNQKVPHKKTRRWDNLLNKWKIRKMLMELQQLLNLEWNKELKRELTYIQMRWNMLRLKQKLRLKLQLVVQLHRIKSNQLAEKINYQIMKIRIIRLLKTHTITIWTCMEMNLKCHTLSLKIHLKMMVQSQNKKRKSHHLSQKTNI